MLIQITTDKDHYHPGDAINGEVRIELQNAINAQNVEVQLLGLENAIFGNGENTYTEKETIIDENTVLWEDSKGGMLGPGIVTFPFSFTLPPGALPTLIPPTNFQVPDWAAGKGIKKTAFGLAGNITYTLKAWIDKPLVLLEKRAVEVPVLVRAFPFPHVQARHLACNFMHPSRNLKVRVEIDACSIKRGDAITGRIEFWKHPMIKVRGVTASLSFQSLASSTRFKGFKNKNGVMTKVSQRTDTIRFPVDPRGEYFTWEFKLRSVKNGPITVSGKLVKVRWLLDVQIDLPLKRDPHVSIPVIVLPITATIEAPAPDTVLEISNEKLELKIKTFQGS
nr:hypothetical protein [Candidatus Sigynarchaeota archaeon]